MRRCLKYLAFGHVFHAKSAETGHSECPVSIQLAVFGMNPAVDESAAESQCS